jgi:hypothetical protein
MFQPTSSRSSKTAGSCLATALGRDCEHNRAPRWSSVPIIVNEPDGITSLRQTSSSTQRVVLGRLVRLGLIRSGRLSWRAFCKATGSGCHISMVVEVLDIVQ